MSNISETKGIHMKYPDDTKAVELKEDGTGFVYYENGKVAICVSKGNEYAKRVLCYDNDPYYTLVCSIDEFGCGYALSNGKGHGCLVPGCKTYAEEGDDPSEKRKPCEEFKLAKGTISNCANCPHSKPEHMQGEKLIMTKDKNVITDEKGRITHSWRWDSKKQNAGKPPQDAVHIELCKYLDYTFINRKKQEIKFSNNGINITIECGYIVKRDTISFEESMKSKSSLMDRYELHKQAMKSKAMINNPHSKDVSNQSIKEIMEGLENLQKEIKEKNKVSSSCDPKWVEESMTKTLLEIPPIYECGEERGNNPIGIRHGKQRFNVTTLPPIKPSSAPNGSTATMKTEENFDSTQQSTQLSEKDRKALEKQQLESTLQQTGKNEEEIEKMLKEAELLHEKISKRNKLNSFKVRCELERENPVLDRPCVLNQASGRYNIYKPIKNHVKPSTKSYLLTQNSYDDYINEYSKSQLVLVSIIRSDVSICRSSEQLIDLVYGDLLKDYDNDLDRCPYRFAKYDLCESDFLKKRFNISGIPLYIMYYNNNIVYYGTLGGSVCRLSKSNIPPRVLFVEPDASTQIKSELLFRTCLYQYSLALDLKIASKILHEVIVEKAISSMDCVTNGHGYGIVLISSVFDNNDWKPFINVLNEYRNRVRDKTTPQILIVNSVPLGTVGYSKKLCAYCENNKFNNKNKKDVTTGASDYNIRSSACSRCHVIENAAGELLCDGNAYVCVMKPINRYTLSVLSERWFKQDLGNSLISSFGEIEGDARYGLRLGMTKDNVIKELEKCLELGRAGHSIEADKSGYVLSSETIQFKGKSLKSK